MTAQERSPTKSESLERIQQLCYVSVRMGTEVKKVSAWLERDKLVHAVSSSLYSMYVQTYRFGACASTFDAFPAII